MHCAERLIEPQAVMEHSGFVPRMHNIRVVKRAHYDVLEGVGSSGLRSGSLRHHARSRELQRSAIFPMVAHLADHLVRQPAR